jgi:diguanylate cyclase (GGDEF)-like protein
VQRLVTRLAKISPHRQIQLLCAVSVIVVAVLVLGVLSSLGPTQRSLQVSNDELLPAVQPLNEARLQYNNAADAFVLSSSPDAGVKAQGISALAAANAGGEAAWKAYVASSALLPGERALQRGFVAHRKETFDAGLILVATVPSAADLANITRLTNLLRLDLNNIKALYETRLRQTLHAAKQNVDATGQDIKLVAAGAIFILLIVFGFAYRSACSREERLEGLDRTLHEEAERNELEARLQRSLEMAQTEPAAYTLVGRALSASAPGVPAELLVADSSRAHFHQAVATDELSGPGCPVMSPNDCPAASWGQTQIWNSSTALDACPYLQSRPEGACSAVCVPVSIGGKTVGVVHATAPDEHPPEELVVAKIELIARKVGERVGMQRAFKRSETQAHTDPLTGLMNRRSLEEQVRALAEEGSTFVAVYADLDHFKQLNDMLGHDAGDQALRLFARVLREAVRPGDLTARYGGEEFVIVLPDCEISDAFSVVNRLRESLTAAQAISQSPPFTASFGMTAARPEETFSETLALADAALLKAKATGRDRIVISGREAAPAAPDPTIDAAARMTETPTAT